MRGRLARFARSRFFRFLIAGGIAAIVNLTSRIALSNWLSFRWAVAAAYLAGMLTAWVLARRFVFENSGRYWAQELTRFALVNCVALVQVWLVSVGLAEYVFPHIGFTLHAESAAHLIGVASPVLTSYVAHKHFSFAGS
jgi:putative flippase GtrA